MCVETARPSQGQGAWTGSGVVTCIPQWIVLQSSAGNIQRHETWRYR